MSRSRRNPSGSSSTGLFRRPKGKRATLRADQDDGPGIRRKAVPPSAWDDVSHGRECSIPWRVAERMLKDGRKPADIARRLSKKWRMPLHEAARIVKYIQEAQR